ncbi:hypothetical protein CRYUN_Cryun18bG0012700 [Craigia yunnanensis]
MSSQRDQQHLKKVGLEGPASTIFVCQVPQVYKVTKELVTNYSGTSQHQYYGERSISEGGPQVFAAKESIVSSNKAAQFYGETLIIAKISHFVMLIIRDE